jgi:hypothetical protein
MMVSKVICVEIQFHMKELLQSGALFKEELLVTSGNIVILYKKLNPQFPMVINQ